MTTYVHGTAIVTAAVAANLRELSRRLDKGHCAGMFTVGLSATGNAPATHYISSGWIPQAYANTIRSNTLLFTRAKKAWEDDGDVFPFSQTQVTNALSKCTLTNGTIDKLVDGVMTNVPESPHEMMARLGLQFVRTAI